MFYGHVSWFIQQSNVILEGKARALRDIGTGNRPNRSGPLPQQEEETMWNCGQLGISTSMAIINTLWFLLTQHFGLRGRQEHHTMNLEDFTITKKRLKLLKGKLKIAKHNMQHQHQGKCLPSLSRGTWKIFGAEEV